MNRLLIRSDHLTDRSDCHAGRSSDSAPQTTPQTGARPSPARAAAAWIADGDLQALWAAELPLCQWTGAWSEAIPGHQSAWRATASGLRAERRSRARRPLDRQPPRATRSDQRDLRDQRRTPAPARGSRVDRHGPGPCRLRPGQGRRYSCRHGGVLPRRQRLAAQSGGGR